MSISAEEFYNTPCLDDGTRRAYAECRVCGLQVMVLAEICGGEVAAYSTGVRPMCDNQKCGDKFPNVLNKMATPEDHAYWLIRAEIERAYYMGGSLFNFIDALEQADDMSGFRAAIEATADLMHMTGDEE